MKIPLFILGAMLLVITVILLFLVKSGGALKPAGVIKPTVIGPDLNLIGERVALRLYPEFHEAKNAIWYLKNEDSALAGIPQITFINYQNRAKVSFQDLRSKQENSCSGNCWYIQRAGDPLPEFLVEKMKTESSIELYVEYFNRNEEVSSLCESEKILETKCVRPIAVREIRRKLKSPEPHFFMQRYERSQFFLFVEKPKS